MDQRYIPNGSLQGDSKAIPDRGTARGVTDTYGADLSGDATNRMGSITSATKSDPWDEDMPDDPTTGSVPGDAAEDRSDQ